ncbi:MAG: alpha/beta hydrolase [Phycisphaeraceae bacterium]|nr:MAG: alpha/beta hydrolase [Phycisphaeraceae bacterium]
MADAFGLAALLGIGLALYVCVLIVYTARSLTHPPRRTYASAVARNVPGDPSELDEPLEFEDRRIDLGKNEVRCWMVEGRDPSGPTVILSPGWGDSRVGALVRVRAFVPFASRVAMVDPPGHGDTPGACDLGAMQSTLLLKSSEALAGEVPVVLAGWSLGAGVSIEAAARHDDDPQSVADKRARIVGVIAEAPYRLVRTPAERVMRARGLPVRFNLGPAFGLIGFSEGVGPRWRDFDRAMWAAKLACPLLVLHGTDDPVSPIEDGREIASAAPEGEIIETAGAGHNDLWTNPDFRERQTEAIARFFRETIARAPAPTIPA